MKKTKIICERERRTNGENKNINESTLASSEEVTEKLENQISMDEIVKDEIRHRKTPQPIEEMLNLALNEVEESHLPLQSKSNSPSTSRINSPTESHLQTQSHAQSNSQSNSNSQSHSNPQSQSQTNSQSQGRIRKPSTPVYNSTNNRNRQPYHLVMLNSDSPFAEATRSLYFGNLPLACTIRDICDVVRGEKGLESVRLLPTKSCAFVDFIGRTGAERFMARVRRSRSRIQIGGNEIKLGWAMEKIMLATVGKAIENGATRNVYLSLPLQDPQDPLLIKFNDYLRDSVDSEKSSDYFINLESEEITSLDDPLVSFLYGIFDEFGPLDMIKVVPGRRIAFIHMAQVADAMRAVAELPTRNEFKGKRLSFGRDRCGERMSETETLNVNSNFENSGSYDVTTTTSNNKNTNVTTSQSQTGGSQLNPLAASHSLSRTIYLGACNSPEITLEDICDHIHTGQLQSVRINRERKCAFVTFISGEGAEAFLGRILQFGLVIRNCQLKPAFAKENGNVSSNSSGNLTSSSGSSSSLPTAIVSALRKGYTRNLYLGNLDFSILTESRLRTEMSNFGPLDRVQILKDRGVAFVHFANLLDGGRAFEQVKVDVCYRNCRVGFGRDRCEPPIILNSTQQNQNYSPNIFNFNPNINPYYLNNYPPPPPPFYFHPNPMMYDPANILYHPFPLPLNIPLLPQPTKEAEGGQGSKGELEFEYKEKYKDKDKDKDKEDKSVNENVAVSSID